MRFRRITVQDGLSNNTIYALAQDREGFLWIGTRDGLHRYDGYSFTVYEHVPDDSTSLAHNIVWTLLVDRNDRLWVGTADGLHRYDTSRDTFVRIPLGLGTRRPGETEMIRTLAEDRRGRLWVGTDKGLYLLDSARRTSIAFVSSEAGLGTRHANPNAVRTLFEDVDGRMWVGTVSGTHVVDEAAKVFRPISPLLPSSPRIDGEVRQIVGDDDGGLWIGTFDAGLYYAHQERQIFVHYRHDPTDPASLPSNSIRFVHLDHGRTPVVGTYEGLSVFDAERQVFVTYRNHVGDPYSLTFNSMRCMLEDQQGNWWIGTWEGLNFYDRVSNRYRLLRHVPGESEGLQDNTVYAVAEDSEGGLWVGTQLAGLHYFRPGSRSPRIYRSTEPGRFALPGNNVHTLLFDARDDLWIGMHRAGLCRLRADRSSLTCYVKKADDPTTISGNDVYVAHEDRMGRLWFGTNVNGLNRYVPDGGRFVRYEADGKPGSLSHHMVTSMLTDHLGAFWIGTGGGLNLYQPESDQFFAYFHDARDPHTLASSHIRHLYQDRAGTMWVGTTGGLSRFDRRSDSFVNFGSRDGLPDDNVHCILEDDAGHLWIGTERGIAKFDPAHETFQSFTFNEDRRGTRFNENACLRRRSGELFFGATNGLSHFYPDRITTNQHVPPVYLTELRISNLPVRVGAPYSPLQKQLRFVEKLTLSHDQNTVAFGYAALDYVAPRENRYAYMLEGYDDQWNEVGTQRTAVYTRLPAGTFTLHVRAANNDGIWNMAGTSLQLRILPPPWRTPWALTAYAILGLGLMLGGWRYGNKLARLRRALAVEQVRRQSEETLHEAQLHFFTNISHEFRTPLTLILGPVEDLLASEPLETKRDQLHIVRRNTVRLLHLINHILDFRKLEAGQLQLRAAEGNLVSFISELAYAFDGHARHRNVQLRITSSHEVLPAWFDAEKLETIFINLVSNAFRFTPAGGRITVALRRSDDADAPPIPEGVRIKTVHACISVQDTGAGMSIEEQQRIFDRFYQGHSPPGGGSGIGLAIAKGIVELHSGQIAVASAPGRGSTFTVFLPLGDAHLEPFQKVGASDTTHAIDPDVFFPIEDPDSAGTEHGEPPTSGRPRVLVVDDNADMRAHLRSTLSDRYQVIEAGDGVEGLRLAVEATPTLILCDVMMGDLDGVAFCHRIKSDLRTGHIPVILLTARTSVEQRLAGFEIGADDYITKPFHARYLRTRIQNLITQRRLLRERMELGPVVPMRGDWNNNDEQFLEKLTEIIRRRIADPFLNVEALSEEMSISREHLHRKLTALTQLSPSAIIRTMRLQQAARLLLEGSLTVAEIAYQVGFNTPSHFSTAFKKHFNQTPTDYVEQARTRGAPSGNHGVSDESTNG